MLISLNNLISYYLLPFIWRLIDVSVRVHLTLNSLPSSSNQVCAVVYNSQCWSRGKYRMPFIIVLAIDALKSLYWFINWGIHDHSFSSFLIAHDHWLYFLLSWLQIKIWFTWLDWNLVPVLYFVMLLNIFFKGEINRDWFSQNRTHVVFKRINNQKFSVCVLNHAFVFDLSIFLNSLKRFFSFIDLFLWYSFDISLEERRELRIGSFKIRHFERKVRKILIHYLWEIKLLIWGKAR